MKKNSLLISIICILLTLLFNVTGVRATTGRPGASGNGTGMSAPGSSSICPNWTTTSTLCVYNNKNHASVRFTLMRYDPSKSGNNKYTQVGKSVYFMSNTSYSIDEVKYLDKNGNVKTDKNIVSEKRLINGKDPDSGKIWYASGHNINPDGIQSHFVTKNGHLSQNSLDLFQRMKIKKSENFPVPKDDKISELSAFLINEVAGQECSVSFGSDGSSEEKCKDIKRRYRIVVEPVYSFWTGPKDNKIVYYTAKAIAASGKDLTNGDRWCEIANLLYLEKKDDKFGGFTAGKSYGSSTTCNQGGTHDNLTGNAKSSRNALKKFKNGQGYNIIKFWDDDDIPTPKVCKYNDTDYFKKNRSGSSTPTSKKGSGPNGENCCDLDYIAPN